MRIGGSHTGRFAARGQAWLSRSVGNRMTLASVATALTLVLAVGTLGFPVIVAQAWRNFEEDANNSLKHDAERLVLRLDAARQNLVLLAKSSFVVNAYVDSTGREIYLQPTLRDFQLPFGMTSSLVLFDANLTPFAGNHPGFAATAKSTQTLAAIALKEASPRMTVSQIDGRPYLAMAFPIYYPPASDYEGVLIGLIEVDRIFPAVGKVSEGPDCLTLTLGEQVVKTWGCVGGTRSYTISQNLQPEFAMAGDEALVLKLQRSESALLAETALIVLLYLILGAAIVFGAYLLSQRAGRRFVDQLNQLAGASEQLVQNPHAQVHVSWENPDEIGRFVGSFNRMVAALQDLFVTLDKRVADRTQELHKRETALADAQRIAHVGSWEWDIVAGTRTWSHELYRILGYLPEEVEASHEVFMARTHPEDRQKVQDAMDLALEGRRIYKLEHRIVRPAGEERYVEQQGVVERDDSGAAVRMLGAVLDVTERMKLERMKNEFVSTVSHELRTPLTSIRGAVGLVIGQFGDSLPQNVREMLELANRNSERLSDLVNDLLDLGTIESGRFKLDFKPVDLVVVAKRALEENTGYAKRYEVKLVCVESPAQAPVSGDEQRLLQVLANLISNAIKFSPPQASVELSILKSEQGFRVSVADHGSGVPESFRHRLFTRFAQADSSDTRQRGGSGLGLSITKVIVQRHRGRIGHEETPGGGATFWFELPAADAGAGSQQA